MPPIDRIVSHMPCVIMFLSLGVPPSWRSRHFQKPANWTRIPTVAFVSPLPFWQQDKNSTVCLGAIFAFGSLHGAFGFARSLIDWNHFRLFESRSCQRFGTGGQQRVFTSILVGPCLALSLQIAFQRPHRPVGLAVLQWCLYRVVFSCFPTDPEQQEHRHVFVHPCHAYCKANDSPFLGVFFGCKSSGCLGRASIKQRGTQTSNSDFPSVQPIFFSQTRRPFGLCGPSMSVLSDQTWQLRCNPPVNGLHLEEISPSHCQELDRCLRCLPSSSAWQVLPKLLKGGITMDTAEAQDERLVEKAFARAFRIRSR